MGLSEAVGLADGAGVAGLEEGITGGAHVLHRGVVAVYNFIFVGVEVLGRGLLVAVKGLLLLEGGLHFEEVLHSLDLGLHLLDGVSSLVLDIQVERLDHPPLQHPLPLLRLLLVRSLKVIRISDRPLLIHTNIYYIIVLPTPTLFQGHPNPIQLLSPFVSSHSQSIKNLLSIETNLF